MTMTPLEDRVMILQEESETKSAGGIFFPDNLNDNSARRGKVIAAGPGRLSTEGERIPLDVKVGDTVVIRKNTGFRTTVEGTEYIIVAERDCIATIESN